MSNLAFERTRKSSSPLNLNVEAVEKPLFRRKKTHPQEFVGAFLLTRFGSRYKFLKLACARSWGLMDRPHCHTIFP